MTPVQLHHERLACRAADATALRDMQSKTKKGLVWAAYRNGAGDHLKFMALQVRKGQKAPAMFTDIHNQIDNDYAFVGWVDLEQGLITENLQAI